MTDKAMAEYYNLTPQTLVNWKKEPKKHNLFAAIKFFANMKDVDFDGIARNIYAAKVAMKNGGNDVAANILDSVLVELEKKCEKFCQKNG